MDNHSPATGSGLRTLYSTVNVINCIVWANGPKNMLAWPIRYTSEGLFFNYTNIGEDYPGQTTINVDPLFVDMANGNYRLQPNSPCIDAGNPASPNDPDGTRADMGAFYFAHTSTMRSLPTRTELVGAYPNPFNPSTTIRFTVATGQEVVMELFTLSGQHVRTVVDAHMVEGTHSVVWDGRGSAGRSAASGVYFYRFSTLAQTFTKRMTLVR
ncbi:MAG: T9SS type A sorting domain-containing protein [Candidatus Latescibacteria bacterium]|nr:T9SS type A sorting domain-containing protein [Candidatus Latescibacterota bacterium]